MDDDVHVDIFVNGFCDQFPIAIPIPIFGGLNTREGQPDRCAESMSF